MTTRLTFVPEDVDGPACGPVEIAWYPDRVEITAAGAGCASIRQRQLGVHGQGVVVELRPSELEPPDETVPGAD